MSGRILFLPGTVPCELCEQDVARVPLEGLWLCDGCFRSFEDSQPRIEPAPPVPEEPTGPSLQEMIEDLMGCEG